jgi:hypothetical protein
MTTPKRPANKHTGTWFIRLAKRSELKRAKERMGDGVLDAIMRGELVAMNPTDSEIATTREVK